MQALLTITSLALVLCAAVTGVVGPGSREPGTTVPQSNVKGTVMTAHGTFDVRVIPQATNEGGGPFSRVFLEKDLRGDLAGTSKGHMLGAETAVEGSGGYVALELVTGTLNGRAGRFVLQHAGHMAHGVMSMTVTVVPDSGTDELTGLAGTFTITINEGKHLYAFEYTLRK
jgi:hypothetical protein